MSLSERLNKRITLRTTAQGQDAAGQPLLTPVDLAEVWAEVKDVAGDAFVGADQVERSTRTEMTIRALGSLPPNLEVSYKSATYRVEAVLGQDNRTQKLICVKVEA